MEPDSSLLLKYQPKQIRYIVAFFFVNIATMTSATRALFLSPRLTRTAMQNVAVPSTVSVSELALPLSDGLVLAGQRYTYQPTKSKGGQAANDGAEASQQELPHKTKKILALHGWLDNCRSFHLLAPSLISRMEGKAELVALDLPGHGWSSHKSLDGPSTVLTEGVYYVAEALDKLGWTNKTTADETHIANGDMDDNRVTLVGHSMGGGISVCYAGVFPENVDKLVLLDIYTPLPGESKKTASVIRSHIEARQKGPKPNRIYKSLDQAIQTRRLSAAKAPGNQSLSLEAATELVTRGMVEVPGEGYSFRHDTRLLWPSLQYLMPEQIDSILSHVECPTCIIAAESGWPFKVSEIQQHDRQVLLDVIVSLK
jgi:pimeloyl-ACP methyl ester carboxylesterase